MGFTASSIMSRFFLPWKKTSHQSNHTRNQNEAFPEQLCRRFSLVEIIIATEGFNQRLYIGSGSFASVYKGSIDDGATVVAIKRLNISSWSAQSVSAFETEVLMFCQLGHPNLVSFIGFCKEEGECILVYEYMPNGSLADYFFMTCNDPLSWKQRLNICIGVARGIHYLHTGFKRAIIHRDIKSLTILLDQSLVPKLSAFGLSKMGPPNLSNALIKTDSRVAGSVGYLDPEYAQSGQLTLKSDVYSFGIVLFEVLCAKLAREFLDCRESVTLLDIMDPFLVGNIAPDCLNKFMEIAQRCVHPAGAERPTIGEVLVELEYAWELQESADANKMLGTNTSLGSAHAYTYEGITFRAIRDIFFWFAAETDNDFVVDHSNVFFF